MKNACELQQESCESVETDPVEAKVAGTRNKIGRLTLDPSAEKSEREDMNRYLAQHPELWLSGF